MVTARLIDQATIEAVLLGHGIQVFVYFERGTNLPITNRDLVEHSWAEVTRFGDYPWRRYFAKITLG